MEEKDEYDNSNPESIEDILKPKEKEDKTFSFEIEDGDHKGEGLATEQEIENLEPKKGFVGSIKEKIELAKTEKELEKEDVLNEPKKGFVGSIKEKVTAARESKKDVLDKTAGLNFSIKDEGSVASREEKSIFQQSLTPLSSAEISILQAEVAADETVFGKIESGRTATLARQQIGFTIGLTMAFFFYLAQGIYYFEDTLMNTEVPSWTPQILIGEPIEAILFAAGAVIPVLMIFVISTGTRQLISGFVDFKLEKIIWGVISFVLALASFAALWRGDVISALMFGGVYLVILFIARVFRI